GRIGLPAKDMDCVATGGDVGAADFLTGPRDPDGSAPRSAIVGRLAKIEWLTNRTHIACSGQEVNGVANRKKAAVLHRIVPGRRSNNCGSAPGSPVVCRRPEHEVSARVADHVDAIAKSNPAIGTHKRERR